MSPTHSHPTVASLVSALGWDGGGLPDLGALDPAGEAPPEALETPITRLELGDGRHLTLRLDPQPGGLPDGLPLALAVATPDPVDAAFSRRVAATGLPTLVAAPGPRMVATLGLHPGEDPAPLLPGDRLWGLAADPADAHPILEALRGLPGLGPLLHADLPALARLARAHGCGLDLDAGVLEAVGLVVTGPAPLAAALVGRLGPHLRPLGTALAEPELRLHTQEGGPVLLPLCGPSPAEAPRLAEPEAQLPPPDLAWEEAEDRIRQGLSPTQSPFAHAFDRSVGGATLSSGDRVGLLRLDDTAVGLTLVQGTPEGDPYWWAAGLAATACRRLACIGAEPLGLALLLEVRGGEDGALAQEALMGLRQALVALDVDLASARTLLSEDGPRLHLAAVGLIPDPAPPVDITAADAKGLGSTGNHWCTEAFRTPGDSLVLLGPLPDTAPGIPAEVALDVEAALQTCLREGIRMGLLRSARPLEAGGLARAAWDPLGAHLFLPEGGRLDAALFSPGSGGALVTLTSQGEGSLARLCATHGVPFRKIGVTGGGRLAVCRGGQPLADVGPEDLPT